MLGRQKELTQTLQFVLKVSLRKLREGRLTTQSSMFYHSTLIKKV